MFGFIKKRLGHKIMVAIIISVLLVLAVEMAIRLYFGTKDRLEMAALASSELATSTYAGIKYPMSVGDNEAIKRELSEVKEKMKERMKDVEVFICDFNQEIIYSTHEDKVKTRVADSIHNKATLQTLTETLKTGVEPQKSFKDVVAGKRYLVTIHPILNQEDCYHCHGFSRKVLGSLIVRTNIEPVYMQVVAARNRTIVLGIFSICAIVALIFTMLTKLVRRPIGGFAERAKRFAEGDMSVSVDVKTEDEIGVLGNTFNYMVKGIKEQIEYANSIKNAICDPLFMVDRDMVVTYMNDACVQLTGYSKTEVEGKMTCREIFKSDICETNCPVRYCFDKGEPVEGIKVYVTNREGKQIPIMASASPLRDARGKLIGAIEICKDITDVLKMEEQMYHTEKLAAVGTMAAGVAHEINNPLAIILGFTDLLTEKVPSDSEFYEILKTIEKQGLNAKRVVENLLGFARYKEYKEEEVSINENLEAVLAVEANTLKLNNIVVNRNMSEPLPRVRGHPGELQEVFFNIINNAISAMNGGGILTVATRVIDGDGRKVEIRILDTGCGIKKEYRAKIFDPFFTTKQVGEGTGLGLSVTYSIVTKHGGLITFETKTKEESEETGTTFIIILPAITSPLSPP